METDLRIDHSLAVIIDGSRISFDLRLPLQLRLFHTVLREGEDFCVIGKFHVLIRIISVIQILPSVGGSVPVRKPIIEIVKIGIDRCIVKVLLVRKIRIITDRIRPEDPDQQNGKDSPCCCLGKIRKELREIEMIDDLDHAAHEDKSQDKADSCPGQAAVNTPQQDRRCRCDRHKEQDFDRGLRLFEGHRFSGRL